MKLIIDTDPGHDDAMALMMACRYREFEVLAVTTVAGNSTIENTTRNARFILETIGAPNIPVFSGAARPLKRALVQASVHGTSGLEGIDPQNKPGLTGTAVDEILRLIAANPGEITLVALGPCTNIALAIQKDPVTMAKVKQIVSMGGAIEAAGNMNRVAEFNMFVDPEAADIVMRFPVPKTLVPLDACNQARMSLDDFKKVTDTALRGLLLKMMRPYIRNIRKDTGFNAAIMYDPLTIFYLIRPQSCRVKMYDVRVETKGDLTRGMTVADRRTTATTKPTVGVVMGVEPEDFTDTFIRILSGSTQE